MFADYITSFVDGRVRVRHPALHDATQAAQVRELLGLMPGIVSVTVNSRTGSLLLVYDPAQLSKEDLIRLGEQWAWQSGESVPSAKLPELCTPSCAPSALGSLFRGYGRRRMSRCVNMGMLTSLGASLAFGMTGRMAGHVAAGGLFVLFNVVHLYMYRRCL